jgi:hypothetical protein
VRQFKFLTKTLVREKKAGQSVMKMMIGKHSEHNSKFYFCCCCSRPGRIRCKLILIISMRASAITAKAWGQAIGGNVGEKIGIHRRNKNFIITVTWNKSMFCVRCNVYIETGYLGHKKTLFLQQPTSSTFIDHGALTSCVIRGYIDAPSSRLAAKSDERL